MYVLLFVSTVYLTALSISDHLVSKNWMMVNFDCKGCGENGLRQV
jgi:hypothetical protein